MEKKKFYINVGAGEISQEKFNNNEEFIIQATEDEVAVLRDKFNLMHEAGIKTFFRAHVPINPYHNDKSNDYYDDEMTQAYRMIHQLGEPETKAHIEQMGILTDGHM